MDGWMDGDECSCAVLCCTPRLLASIFFLRLVLNWVMNDMMLSCDNCHSHAARCLNVMNYRSVLLLCAYQFSPPTCVWCVFIFALLLLLLFFSGYANWNMVILCFWVFFTGTPPFRFVVCLVLYLVLTEYILFFCWLSSIHWSGRCTEIVPAIRHPNRHHSHVRLPTLTPDRTRSGRHRSPSIVVALRRGCSIPLFF